jgi:periplasmic protein CpxP/Spy
MGPFQNKFPPGERFFSNARHTYWFFPFFTLKNSSMKKISLFLLASLALAMTVQAQGGGFNRMTPEERTARLHQKLDSAFKLDAPILIKLDTAITALYKAQDAKRQELMAGGMPDRDTFMAEMKKYSDAQDEILKALLTKDQYDIWKEKIQPSMRPQRQGGGGPPPGGGQQ